MIIDKKLNANYNRLLSEIHDGLGSSCDIRKYRDVVKDYDPNFPRKDGVSISMSDITQDQMAKHMSFIRMFASRRGYKPKDVEANDYDGYKYQTIVASIDPNIKSTMKDASVCRVVCSSCGCSTKRILTDDRVKELIDIQLGNRSEQGGNNSFVCVDCFKERK